MADSTIKPDDGNDLVLQNNHGDGKIEINEDDTVKVTTGSATGDDFTVNTSQLVVEGDTGNVGVGTATPSLDSGSSDVVMELEGNDAVIALSSTYSGGSQFAIQSYNGNLTVSKRHSSKVDILKVADDGDVTINDGDLVIGTAGKGIDFSNATDQLTGESNVGSVLDDYEEGTWTPTLNNSGSSTVTAAKYRKVGNMVTVWARIGDISTSASYDTSAVLIATPVPSITNEEYVVGSLMGNGIDLSGKITMSTYVYNNNFYFYFTSDSLASWGHLRWSHLYSSGASDIIFCATYPCL